MAKPKAQHWATFPFVAPGQSGQKMPCGCHTQIVVRGRVLEVHTQLAIHDRSGRRIPGALEVNVITGVALCNTLNSDGRPVVDGSGGTLRVKRHTVHGAVLACAHGVWGPDGACRPSADVTAPGDTSDIIRDTGEQPEPTVNP